MKKLIYCAAALVTALFAGSCQRELLDPAGGNGTVTYTVQVPEVGTKALGDDVTVINDLVYAVYRTTENSLQETLDNWEDATYLVYGKNVEGQAYNQGKTTVSLELINNQNYVILFWAQQNDVWVKGNDFDLTKITYPDYLIANSENADKYAAFSGVEFLAAGDFAGQKTAILTRPFAQINIATKDPQNYDVKVTGATITVKNVGNEYNVAKKAPATTKDQVIYTWKTKPETSAFSVNNVEYEHYVAMNYVFAYDNVKVAYDIHTRNHGTVSNEIINVPVEKNYRTNIVGNLLTSNVDYEVTLDKDWESEYVGPEFVQVPAYDADSKTWTVTNADELAWVAASVNGTIGLQTKAGATSKTFKGETVVLANDIDLQGKPWTPIGNGDHANRYEYLFGGTFDGQGHSIKNMNVDYTECAGLFGRICGATIKRVTIDGFNLKSDHYAGAIIGWAETGANPITVENCKALNGTITVNVAEIEDGRHDLGDKAGAIVGYSHHGNYKNNEVNNVIIEGYRDLGAIVGYGNNSVVTDNKISDVTLVQNLECDYKKDEEGGSTPNTIDHFVGRKGGTCTIVRNTGEATIVTAVASGVYASNTENGDVKEYSVYAAEGLKWIAANVDDNDGFAGKTVKLTHDIDLFQGYMSDGDPVSTEPIGTTGEYDDRGRLVCEPFKGTFDGQGHTIKNIYQNGYLWKYWFGQYGSIGLFSELESATVKNLVIDNFESRIEGGDIAFITGSATGNCVFENIEIKNSRIATFNNGIGGIIGWSGAGNYTFKNIKLDAATTIGGFQQSFDSSVGGIVGQAEPGATYNFENIEISCRLDVYNDVTASWQYYLYRMCGMIIGRCEETTTINGVNYPDLSKYNLSFNNVVVNYGDWMNYHYQECSHGPKGNGARVEAGFLYDGHPTCAGGGEVIYLPFDQLIGGDQLGVRGLREVEGVTVNYPASYRREVSTAAALTEALGKGVSVILDADIDLGSTILTMDKGQTLDLGGKTLTQSGQNRGIILKNGASIKNGVINHSGTVAAVRAWNVESIENVTINLETPASGTVTGIAVQQYSNVGTIKNVTVTGAGVTQAIEVQYQATVDLIEDVTVDNSTAANGVALVINGGNVGKAKNCTFKGNAYGVTMHLKGEFAVGLELENCKVEGTTASIYAWDEKGKSNTSGSLNLTYDAATTLTGPFVWDFEEECQSVVTLNCPQ